VRQERLASGNDVPAAEERRGQIVGIPDGTNDVRRILEVLELSVELEDRLRIAPLEGGRIEHRGLGLVVGNGMPGIDTTSKVTLRRSCVEVGSVGEFDPRPS
jgi:hypothetical protein